MQEYAELLNAQNKRLTVLRHSASVCAEWGAAPPPVCQHPPPHCWQRAGMTSHWGASGCSVSYSELPRTSLHRAGHNQVSYHHLILIFAKRSYLVLQYLVHEANQNQIHHNKRFCLSANAAFQHSQMQFLALRSVELASAGRSVVQVCTRMSACREVSLKKRCGDRKQT